MAPVRVLICGAGVGGNALSFWLAKFPSFDVTVVERYPSLRVSGLQLDIRAQGIDVIKRMGLEAVIRSKCVPERGIQLVDTHDRQWAYLPANTSGKGAQTFTSEFEIMRGDLCHILNDGAKHNVKYKFGTSVTSYTDEGSGPIEVQFADGTSEQYDLLVGADGLHSRTRRMMLEPGKPDGLQTFDEYIAYCRVPMEMKAGEVWNATVYFAAGNKFIMTRWHNQHNMQVYLTGNKIGKRLGGKRGDVAAEKEAFADEFRGAGWKSDELLSLVQKSDDFYCQQGGFVKLEHWSRGRVALLGDAGYSTSVNGFGTSCALIGAYILAGELVRNVGPNASQPGDAPHSSVNEGIRSALEAYEGIFQPFIELQQKPLTEKGPFDDFEFKAWHIRILYWVAWLASVTRVYKLLNLFSTQGKESWQLPDYPELKLQASEKGDAQKREG